MIDDPIKMIRGMVMLAPELNMKVALLNLVDYIDEKINVDDDFDETQFRVEDLLEVVVESLVKLHHHVGEDDGEHESDDWFNVGGKSYTESPITNDEVEKFKKLLGIIPDEDKKEETND